MKKLILSLAVVLALFSTAFAKIPDGAKDRAAAAFHKDFYKASELNWTVVNNHVRVTFTLDNETMFAYYDFQGNMIGLVHHIVSSKLPENLKKELQKHYSNYWVTELFKVTTEEGENYYIQLTNADETIVLNTQDGYGWHRFMSKKATDL
jgi:hypothetical protein